MQNAQKFKFILPCIGDCVIIALGGVDMKLKKISIILAIIGLLAIIISVGAAIPAINANPTGGVGIIGGAGAPTFLFMLTTGWRGWALFIGVVSLIASLCLTIINKKKQ